MEKLGIAEVPFDFGRANEEQIKAIKHDRGPMLIIAGPGTGKTFTLVNRLLYLIREQGVAAEKIMVCTFTEKAAKELITRITNECVKYGINVDLNAMYIGTIHSICLRIIKENVEYLENFNKNFRMLDEKTQNYTVHSNLNFFYQKMGGRDAFTAKLYAFGPYKKEKDWRSVTICKLVNKFSEEMVDPKRLIESAHTPGFLEEYKDIFDNHLERQSFLDHAVFLGELLKTYEELSVEKGFLDFASIQTKCYKLLENKEVLKRVQEKIEYLMIDEYQDTNYVQEQLMFAIAGDKKNICVVGDEDQALYRFRGATVRNILEFPEKIEKMESDCKTVKIDTNYRSDPSIIKLYNLWMDSPYGFSWSEENRLFRYPKEIKPDPERQGVRNAVLKISGQNYADRICDFIKNLKDSGKITDYNQVVILGSTVNAAGAAGSKIMASFEKNGIPIFSPRSGLFFSRDEVMLAIGILKKVIYVYAEEVINRHKKEFPTEAGTGDDDLDYANDTLQKAEYQELNEWVRETINSFRKNQNEKDYTDFTYTELLYRMYAFEPFRSLMGTDAEGNAYDTREVRNLAILTQLTGKYEEIRGISLINPNNLDHAESFFDHYLELIKSGRMEEFESDTDYAPSGCVSFMTIHQSKGMEFPVVITLLDHKPFPDFAADMLIRKLEYVFHQKPYEPDKNIIHSTFPADISKQSLDK